ncbi:MAG: hypothetical protein WBN30_19105 [Polyangiales bacterium]
MAKLIEGPKRMEAAGTMPKTIDEFVGRARSGDTDVSIARVVSPAGWEEPKQTPEFSEYTVVLRGMLRAGVSVPPSALLCAHARADASGSGTSLQ